MLFAVAERALFIRVERRKRRHRRGNYEIYLVRHLTEIFPPRSWKFPPPIREVERGNLAKFSCFLTNKRWPQIVPFSPGQTGIRMADAFYILPRLETGSVG